MKQQLRQGFHLFMAVMLSLSTLNVMFAPSAAATQDKKVFVCKYVGTPNQNERLQTGQNPISVAVNSIKDYQGVGSYFNDAQGRSYVLAKDNKDAEEPDVSQCPPAEPGVIAVPSVDVIVNCGPDNDVYGMVPAGEYEYVVNPDGSITLTAHEGYVFVGGEAQVTLPAIEDENTICPPQVVPTPAKPGVSDPCGPRNAMWIVPENTTEVSWVLKNNGNLVAYANEGYVFANGKTHKNFGKAHDNNVPCPIEVTPKKPYAHDYCGSDHDKYKIRYTEGVQYKVNGENVTTGYHMASGDSVTVTAHVKPGYVFSEGATTEWTFEFDDDDCLDITKKAVGIADTNQSGETDFGDTVEWEITVTNTSDRWYDNFYVEVEDDMAVIDGDNYVDVLAPGESHTFTAYSKLLEDEIEACKATNTANYNARYTRPNDEEEVLVPLTFNGGHEYSDEFTFSGSASAEVAFDCPAPGQGGGGGGEDDEDTPEYVPSSPLKPAKAVQTVTELPQTGAGSPSALLFAMLMSVLTYGAVYFAQGRKAEENL